MRNRSVLSAIALVVLLAGGFVAGRAHAAQTHMVAALDHLRAARRNLENATADKGGHRERAIGAVDRAIEQVQAGIEYARH
jgi:hypothetical protein